jgi:GDP-4-dehydro-6-deoxy-D-mannose reductase
MKALVTGIKGFVGRYLENELVKNHYDVFGITLEASDKEGHIKGDILDREFMGKTVASLKPDIVFHLAGFSSGKESWDRPALAMKVNQGGTEILYEAVASFSPDSKVILISSAEVYGILQNSRVNEKHSTAPVSPYGKSKLAQEAVAEASPLVKTIICRSFPHTGPKQSPILSYQVLPNRSRRLKRGSKTAFRSGI